MKKQKSWRTTTAGIVAAVAGLLALAAKGLGEGLENVNWGEVVGYVSAIAAGIGLFSARDDKVSSEGTTAQKDDPHARQMPPALLLVLLLLPIASGCQNLSPTQRYALTSDTYVATLRGISAASRLGKISTDDLIEVSKARQQLEEIFEAWHDALVEGRDLDAQFYFAAAQRVLDKIHRMKLRADDQAGPLGDQDHEQRTRSPGSPSGEHRGSELSLRPHPPGPGGRQGPDPGRAAGREEQARCGPEVLRRGAQAAA